MQTKGHRNRGKDRHTETHTHTHTKTHAHNKAEKVPPFAHFARLLGVSTAHPGVRVIVAGKLTIKRGMTRQDKTTQDRQD
jgi:hypothetical protein